MKTIYKYEIEIGSVPTWIDIQSPCTSSLPLHFGEDGLGDLCMWHEVETDSEKSTIINYELIVYGTGESIPENENVWHYGTVVMKSGLVWHIYRDHSSQNKGGS